MARESKSGTEQLDIEGVRQLMELMVQHDVSELRMQQGTAKYHLRRGPQGVVVGPTSPVVMQQPHPMTGPQPVNVLPKGGSGEGTNVPPAADEGLVPIKSPTVGTFYPAPAPGEAAFVKVGDVVKPDTVVCIVEAMKVFNQIPAGVSGTIQRILLADGDSVEYGQPLFLVKP